VPFAISIVGFRDFCLSQAGDWHDAQYFVDGLTEGEWRSFPGGAVAVAFPFSLFLLRSIRVQWFFSGKYYLAKVFIWRVGHDLAHLAVQLIFLTLPQSIF